MSHSRLFPFFLGFLEGTFVWGAVNTYQHFTCSIWPLGFTLVLLPFQPLSGKCDGYCDNDRIGLLQDRKTSAFAKNQIAVPWPLFAKDDHARKRASFFI